MYVSLMDTKISELLFPDIFENIGDNYSEYIFIKSSKVIGFGKETSCIYELDLIEGKEIVLSIPGIPDAALIIKELAELEILFSDKIVSILRFGFIAFRLPKILHAVAVDNGIPLKDNNNKWVRDPVRDFVDLEIEFIDGLDNMDPIDLNIARKSAIVIKYDSNEGMEILFNIEGISFSPSNPIEIGDTGLLLIINSIMVNFIGQNKGVYIEEAKIFFGGDLSFIPIESLGFENGALTEDGFGGLIKASFELDYDSGVDPNDENDCVFKGDACGRILGIHIGLRKFEIELHANEVVSSEITGQILFPFFNKPIEIELLLDLRGNIAFGLKGTDGAVLAELTKDDLINMKLDSFNFHHIQGQETAFILGGSIKPLFGDINWPEIGVNALKIVRSSNGDWEVKLDGGWIDLDEDMSFEIYNFKGGLKKFGLGLEDQNNRFIGFSGSISFVSGFALAAEFDDLKIIYPKEVDSKFYENIRLELQRAALGFAIPGAVSLIGEVSMKKPGFGGMIDVSIIPMQMRIIGAAEFGKYTDFTYMQIFLDLKLPPPGIVLGTSPASVMGFKGKWAMNMCPSMDPGWTWAITPPKGVTPLSKMVPCKGGKMLGAGIQITTTDGYIITIDALFALLVPGPVVMIEGKGGILADILGEYMPSGATEVLGDSALTEPPFYALVVINGEEQYFSANLDVNGELVKGVLGASGTADIFFDFQNSSNWWIKLGQREPKDKRIQSIFLTRKTQGYFEMLPGPHIEAGGLIGFDARKDFKVGYAVLKAYIEGGAGISWKPEHIHGWLALVVDIGIKVCGFGLGLGASGSIEAMSPHPRFMEILAEYHYFFNMPWPLPDVEGSGEFRKTWEEGEHFPIEEFEQLINMVTIDSEVPGFPLQKLNSYDSGNQPTKLSEVTLVTLDARPTISFQYPINDDTELPLAGNTSNGRILHTVGDARYDFSLKYIIIEKFEIGSDLDALLAEWNEPNLLGKQWLDVPLSFGAWLAGPSITGKEGATHLRLWSKTPFTHFKQRRYTAATMAQTSLTQQIGDANWINSDPTNGNEEIDLDNITADQLDTMPEDSASNLSAIIEEESSEYPLGKPQGIWENIGFMQVPLQQRIKELDAPHGIKIAAVSVNDIRIRPFDVIDIPFFIIEDENSPYHKVKEMVRGIYFQGSIEIRFPFPVEECELYLYPILSEKIVGGEDIYRVFPFSEILNPFESKYPPKILVKGWKKNQDEEIPSSIGHTDERETADGFYIIKISRSNYPIGSVMVNNMGTDLFLVAIGYRLDTKDTYEDGKDRIERFNTNVWKEEPENGETEDQGILKPSSCYRLTVGYNAGENESNGDPKIIEKRFYFRTDGPPAEYIKNYIAWTLPEGNEYPFFREYAVGIHFNSNYIDKLFENTQLEIALQSSGGKFSICENLQKKFQTHRLSPEEQVFIDAVNNSGIDSIDPIEVPKDLILVCDGYQTLEPDEIYNAGLRIKEGSGYKKVELVPDKQEQHFNQQYPSLMTENEANINTVVNSEVPILGIAGPSVGIKANLLDNFDLYQFNFRTSKYKNFVDMITESDSGGTDIKNFPLNNVASDFPKDEVKAYHETWVARKSAIWGTKRLLQNRLAKEEDLLMAQDELSIASQDLDEFFDQVVVSLDLELNMISVQKLPQKTTLYYSEYVLLMELPEPVEFTRLEISIVNKNLITVCNSAETRILIFPSPGEQGFTNDTLEITYKLDLGNDKPRYYLKDNLTTEQKADIVLSV